EAYYREDAHAETRAKYIEHIDRMATLTGANFTSQAVMAIETSLAQHHWDVVKTREAELTHNPTTLDRLAAEAPGFEWHAWADAIHMPAAARDLLIAGEPSFFEAFAAMWPTVSLDEWKAYLRWHVVSSRAPYLT